MNAMNTNNTNNTNVQSLTAAIAALTKVLEEAINIAKEESTTATTGTTATTTEVTATTETATTATETTATTTTDAEATTAETTTTTTTTAPIIVIDDDDNVIATTGDPCPPEVTEFKGSMIEEKPMDPIPTYEENAAAEATQEITDETATAEENADKYLDNISCDISTLYDISTYTLENEGYNIGTDHSPYAPMDNRSASFDNYKVYISKEIIKGDTGVTGEFRMIVSEKNSGVKIMDHSLKIINDHIKASSSENTVRMDKIKDSKKLMRFLEIVDEVSSLIMSKYISK